LYSATSERLARGMKESALDEKRKKEIGCVSMEPGVL
jgi:hypothetical protein